MAPKTGETIERRSSFCMNGLLSPTLHRQSQEIRNIAPRAFLLETPKENEASAAEC